MVSQIRELSAKTYLEPYTVNWLVIFVIFAFLYIVLRPRFIRLRWVPCDIAHFVV